MNRWEVGGHALKIMEISLMIMEKSWNNHGILIWNSCGNPAYMNHGYLKFHPTPSKKTRKHFENKKKYKFMLQGVHMNSLYFPFSKLMGCDETSDTCV